MPSACVYTLGCKSNQYEGKNMMEILADAGFDIVGFFDTVDFYIINTCTVTVSADKKSRYWINKAEKINPKAKIIVAGCLAKIKGKELNLREFISENANLNLPPAEIPPVRVRENLMIENGCNQFCSYCIVPYARGSQIRTKPIDKIIAQAKDFVSRGTKEIILTGINLGLFGSKNLVEVIRKITDIPNLLRLRLSSIEPILITDEIIIEMADNPKVCKHLHIPLQSGDNGMLKKMNRNYTIEDYYRIISSIRSYAPDAGITTDIIVGFPGEREKEFKNSIAAVKNIDFSRIHIFSYSARPGTAAYNFENNVKSQESKERYKIMDNLRSKYMKKFHQKLLGKTVEFLVESGGKQLEGLTSNYVRTLAKGSPSSIGKLIKANIDKIETEYVQGGVSNE